MDGLRSVLSGLLLVVATVLAVVAIAAVWAERQLFDTEVWTAGATEVVHDPAVERQTADFLADQVVTQLDALQRAPGEVPVEFREALATAAAIDHRTIERAALRVIRSGDLDDPWETTIEDTHADFVRWLDGAESRSPGDPSVVLELKPLVTRTALEAGVPKFAVDAAAEMTDTRFTLVDDGQYARARDDAAWLRDRAGLVAPLAIVAAVLSILVARQRRWATVRVGLGAAIAGLLVVAAAPRIGERFMDAMTGDGAAPAVARAIWATTEPPLTQLGWIVAAAGIGLALLAALLWPAPRRRAVEPRPQYAQQYR